MTAQNATAAGASKMNKKKKRKISKHVLQAQQEKLKQAGQPSEPDADGVTVVPAPAQATTTPSASTKTAATAQSSSKKKKNKHVKDPAEAASYLSQWKRKAAGDENVWKFNKNTQSWLIRHMYQTDKLSKTTFQTLLDYLEGLKGGDAKSRILQEASRRAVRYKDYEKARGDVADEEEEAQDEPSDDITREKASNEGATAAAAESSASEQEEEETRWTKLGDHDKRKEYKRARKVLDTLKEASE